MFATEEAAIGYLRHHRIHEIITDRTDLTSRRIRDQCGWIDGEKELVVCTAENLEATINRLVSSRPGRSVPRLAA